MPCDLDLDLGFGLMAYLRASLIDLYLQIKFHLNRRNFLWTDVGHMDGQTDIEAGFIRSLPRRNWPNNLIC